VLYRGAAPLDPDKHTLRQEREARESHPWVIEIVRRRFERGLEWLFQDGFVSSRFGEFLGRADPIYTTLLQGMADEGASRALVGSWMVAHTLATQSRFWLQDAIVETLVTRAAQSEEPRPSVYSLAMLADGWYAAGTSIWNVGEDWCEEIHGRGAWRPLIQEKALDEIERIVGEEERRFESLAPAQRKGGAGAMSERDDQRSLERAALARGGPARPISVRCNLLIVEPECADRAPHAWAIRYVNPTAFNQMGTIKSERINLLRLRAYLAQEKPFRAPGKIRVIAADILPRSGADDGGRASAHFSPLTRWQGEELWRFLDVPFAAVTAGIRDAGSNVREPLRTALRSILTS
jgi:hypothetical protein